MKKAYILPAAIAASLSLTAKPVDQTQTRLSAEETVDTVMSINNAGRAIVTENASGIKLTVEGSENDPEFKSTYSSEYASDAVIRSHQEFEMPFFLKRQHHSQHSLVMKGLHFGFCGTVGAPAGVDVAMMKSFEIGIDNLLAYELNFRGGRDMLSLGIGINWRNYRMTADTRFVATDGSISVDRWPEDVTPRYSRLKIFSLGFPVMYQHRFGVRMLGRSTLNLNFGAILNWNSHGSVSTTWREADGTDAEQKSDKIGHRRFTVDLMCAVQLAPASGLYVKYSPMKLFKNGRGPEFSPISTGFYFMF